MLREEGALEDGARRVEGEMWTAREPRLGDVAGIFLASPPPCHFSPAASASTTAHGSMRNGCPLVPPPSLLLGHNTASSGH